MESLNPFFNQHQSKLALIALAVQEPTLTYKILKRIGHLVKPSDKEERVHFTEDYFGGADIIFCNTTSSWLVEKK